ncbi:MAG: class I SAM-dependent methyltransferase [Chloroflexota bacterium]
MDIELVRELVALNSTFYRDFALSFSDSRAKFETGYAHLLGFIPAGKPTVLDVGCGNGRFGRFLQENIVLGQYTGVDFSSFFWVRWVSRDTGSFKETLACPAA